MSTSKITRLPALIQEAWSRREAEVKKHHWQAFRLVHDLGDKIPGLAIDYYDGDWHATLRDADPGYREQLPLLLERLGRERLSHPKPRIFWTRNTLQERAKAENTEATLKVIRERDLEFQIRLGSGLHTGLFLDQRDNRERIRKISRGRRVLNLFCYTGAFTVAALKGHAREVHSVDLSKPSLEDLRANLRLNALPESAAPLHACDVFDFLKRGRQKGEKFDLIILDPPSFSRSKNLTFSTEKHLAALVESALALLSENGRLFLSINTQKLETKDFHRQIKLAIGTRHLKILENWAPPFDFPQEDPKNPHLKACLLGSK